MYDEEQDVCVSNIFKLSLDPANTYFLTSDMDVSFSYSSIEKLLDLMLRKPSVGGATCRMFAEGSGPVVWYQIYEYAIWHWLVKVRFSFKNELEYFMQKLICTKSVKNYAI